MGSSDELVVSSGTPCGGKEKTRECSLVTIVVENVECSSVYCHLHRCRNWERSAKKAVSPEISIS